MIFFLVVPSYTFEETSYIVFEGHPFEVIPDVTAFPDVYDVTWRRENTERLSSNGNLEITDTSLQINSVRKEDAGTYSISGRNDVGVGTDSFELVVNCKCSFTTLS